MPRIWVSGGLRPPPNVVFSGDAGEGLIIGEDNTSTIKPTTYHVGETLPDEVYTPAQWTWLADHGYTFESS